MKQTFKKLSDEVSAARERLKALIESIPDSTSGIKSLGHNCVSVPFSQLTSHNNWSVSFWVKAETKRALLTIIDNNRSIESTINAIESVIRDGCILINQCRLHLPPEFIQALKKAWEGDNK